MAEETDRRSAVIDRRLYVPHYLALTANALTSGASQLYRAHFGLGINECRLTAVLGHEPGKTALELSQAVAMNKSIVSRSLQTLLSRGLVCQSGPIRGACYRLTEDGWRLHDAIVRMSRAREIVMLDGIDESERAVLLRLLSRILDNVTAMDGADFTPDPPAAS